MRLIADQKFYATLHAPTGLSFARMHPRREQKCGLSISSDIKRSYLICDCQKLNSVLCQL